MKHRIYATISFVILMVCQTNSAFAQRQINKSFKGVNMLYLNTSKGNCKIIKSEDSSLSVKLITQYESDSIPQYSIVQRGTVLSIGEKFHPKSVQGATPEWILIIPENVTISFKTSAGSIAISGLSANFNLSTGKGELFLNKVRGKIKGRTGRGDITVTACSGTLNLQTGKGDITVSKTTGNFHATSANSGLSKYFN